MSGLCPQAVLSLSSVVEFPRLQPVCLSRLQQPTPHPPPDPQLQDDMRRLNSGSEERSRLTAALSCLRSAADAGEAPSRLLPPDANANANPDPEGDLSSEPQQDADVFSPSSPSSPAHRLQPAAAHGRSISISVMPCSDRTPADPELSSPRTCRATAAKCSHTPPPPPRKLLQLLPTITLTRSKSQESQLANRVEETGTPRWVPRLVLL